RARACRRRSPRAGRALPRSRPAPRAARLEDRPAARGRLPGGEAPRRRRPRDARSRPVGRRRCGPPKRLTRLGTVPQEGQVKTDELDAQAEATRQLALAQIRQYPDPVLRLEAQEVEAFDVDLVQLVARMTRLMEDAQGVGLAANQVGVLRRVVVLLADGEEEPRVLVNPVILDRSDETEEETEGCLSLRSVVVPVERAVI